MRGGITTRNPRFHGMTIIPRIISTQFRKYEDVEPAEFLCGMFIRVVDRPLMIVFHSNETFLNPILFIICRRCLKILI